MIPNLGIIIPFMGMNRKDQVGLGAALFSKTQQRVLGLLFGNPGRSYYLNEIVRLAGVGIGAVQRELEKLSTVGLLTVKKIGNQKHYQANPESPIFEELRGIVQKTFGIADVLREVLAAIGAEIEYGFIFGSIAQGKDRVSSDIDLFVIGEVDFVALVGALATTHERLGREINPVIMTSTEFIQKFSQNDRFVCRVMDEPKIFVRGTANDLGKLVEHRTSERASDR